MKSKDCLSRDALIIYVSKIIVENDLGKERKQYATFMDTEVFMIG